MLDYARWKYWLVAIVLLFSLLFALPNVFGDERALQITRKDRAAIDAAQLTQIEDVLKSHDVTFRRATVENGSAIVRDYVRSVSDRKEATSVGAGTLQTSAAHAALLNAASGHAMDYDDTQLSTTP